MYHVEITEPAKNDMFEAAKYIAEQLLNPSAANRLLDDVESAIFSLESMPERYALLSDEIPAKPGIRFMPVGKYLVFYVIREKTKKVVIQRFLYGRRDWVTILKGGIEKQEK